MRRQTVDRRMGGNTAGIKRRQKDVGDDYVNGEVVRDVE